MCLADKLPDSSSSFLEGCEGKLVLQKCWGEGDSSTQFLFSGSEKNRLLQGPGEYSESDGR